MRLRFANQMLFAVGFFLCLGFLCVPRSTFSETATTTITITICGDGIVQSNEACDDGINTGGYSVAIAGRKCLPGCAGFAQYCGDGVLQASFGETCDDGNNSSGDFCGSTCVAESAPPPGNPSGGFNPGSFTTPTPTKVIVVGKAYPNSDVHILKDGSTVGIVKADPKADFFFSTTDVTPGVAAFGFWAEDYLGLKSIALTVTFTIAPNAVTTISGANIPPTIDLEKRKVKKGETLNMFGQSVPQATIITNVNSDTEAIEKVTSDTSGKWALPFDTSPLVQDDFHTAKSMFEFASAGNIIRSSFGQTVSFFVGEREVASTDLCRRADINKDSRVNLVDFSILLFHWGTSNGDADINIDGKINLTDFSIMLFCWSG